MKDKVFLFPEYAGASDDVADAINVDMDVHRRCNNCPFCVVRRAVPVRHGASSPP